MDLTQLSSQLKLKTDFNAGSSLGLRDINSITGIVDNSVTSLQALIFKNDNPEYDDIDTSNFDVTGITSGYDKQAFVFDIKKEYKFGLSSDITDHYVESNVAIQDHVGLKPIILEVTGSLAEVNLNRTGKKMNEANISEEIENKNEDFTPSDMFNSIDSYLSRMGSLSSFAPNIVNQAEDIYNSAKFAYSTANKIINLNKKDSTQTKSNYIEGYDEKTISQTRQFEKINWFRTQWENRASFTIVTPYGVLNNMYIVELSAVQPENTRYITNLNIKFKQIRQAIVYGKKAQSSRNKEVQETKNQGTIDLSNINVSNMKEKSLKDISGDIDSIRKYSTTAQPEILEVKYKQTFNSGKNTGTMLRDSGRTIMDGFSIKKIKDIQGNS